MKLMNGKHKWYKSYHSFSERKNWFRKSMWHDISNCFINPRLVRIISSEFIYLYFCHLIWSRKFPTYGNNRFTHRKLKEKKKILNLPYSLFVMRFNKYTTKICVMTRDTTITGSKCDETRKNKSKLYCYKSDRYRRMQSDANRGR